MLFCNCAGVGVLGAREIDALSETVLERLLAGEFSVSETTRDLIADLAGREPNLPALFPVLPLTMAAVAIEHMLSDPATQRIAEQTWRMAALIGAEVLALQAEDPQMRSPDIATLWTRLQSVASPLVAAPAGHT